MATQQSTTPRDEQPVEFWGVDDDGNPVIVNHWPLKAAAKRLHVSLNTLRQYLRSGRWPYQPMGRRKYMTDADIVEAMHRERERAVIESQSYGRSYGIKGAVAPLDIDEPCPEEGIR
jgi:hypothetical protein